jgi:hypothetical protein
VCQEIYIHIRLAKVKIHAGLPRHIPMLTGAAGKPYLFFLAKNRQKKLRSWQYRWVYSTRDSCTARIALGWPGSELGSGYQGVQAWLATVKQHLRSGESEPKYPKRVSFSKLDPYAEKLATWLGIEVTKSRQQRRTLRQIYTLSPKGVDQEFTHTVSTFCAQRVRVDIGWKTRAGLQRNSTR